ncbi:MAG: iron-sulfur cluster assembly scaffold protein [Dehalococcoidia bacterium]|nr:iron-sulfur cluster assembly scaffold protein [Dehalococcoidia bacterium]
MANNSPPEKFKGDAIITFEDVPVAIRAEKLLKASGYPCKLVAPPPQFRLGCALGVEIMAYQRRSIETLLEEKDVHISQMVGLDSDDSAKYFNETVIDHFKNPRNVGEIENADAVGHVNNSSLSINADLYLKIMDGVITQARSKSFGCGATIAAGSIITELVHGKRMDELSAINAAAVDKALGGLPESKSHTATMAADLVASAVADYNSRQSIGK